MSSIIGEGSLSVVINRAKSNGYSLKDLTVLSPQLDPYRFDTPANHQRAAWFAEQIQRFVRYGTVHLRGLHYLLTAAADVVLPGSEGKAYANTDECWGWMSDKASNAARWLGYVPFERIVDQRNDPPEIFAPEFQEPCVNLEPGVSVDIPVGDCAIPEFRCDFAVKQPYRIAFFGEKSSLAPVLRPIARRIGAEMLLPTGEASGTMVAGMVDRATADGRPPVVLYFADFDPSGHQMVVSVSRKMQALRDLYYPGLNVQSHSVALTLDQVHQFDLPSTPLKESERRGDRWRAVMHHEQTEIDALAALRLNDLRNIALESIEPVDDETLSARIREAQTRWQDDASARLPEHPAYAEEHDKIIAAHEELVAASDRFHDAQGRARELLEEVSPPEPEMPEPEIDIEAPAPLFSSEIGYVAATLRLKSYKALSPEAT
jgi:hypothetical protein